MPFPPAVPPAPVVASTAVVARAVLHATPQPAARLHGIVTDAATGAPVRATITVTGAGVGGAGGRTVRTDAAGRFAFGTLPSGALAVQVAAFG